MSYHLCPNCGQKALTVATRCPRCGVPFETQFFRHQVSGQRPSRIPLALLIAGALAALLVAVALLQSRSVAPPVRLPAKAIESTPQPEPPRRPQRDSLGAAADSFRPALPPPPLVPDESLAPGKDRAPLPAPIPAAEPLGTVAAERRYASTWTNVRADRSSTAPVIRILRPGELVLVDLLEQGWYRVVSDGQAQGYVDRRYLNISPPPTPP